jgi:hypothetical protein
MSAEEPTTERLFSYGTLQLEAVQMATFGRLVTGQADELPRFSQSMVEIDDPEVVRTSGQTHHPIVKYTGRLTDSVPGMAFPITPTELANADKYEVGAYARVAVTLLSGLRAWVYVDRQFAPPTAGA